MPANFTKGHQRVIGNLRQPSAHESAFRVDSPIRTHLQLVPASRLYGCNNHRLTQDVTE
jgi:hypothetical protein